jgi:hypothetical protein
MSTATEREKDRTGTQGERRDRMFSDSILFLSIPTLGAPVDKDLANDFDRTSDQYIPEDMPDLESMVKRVTARYEVVLAAGSVGSGQLLLLSGVGPRDHLNERSIGGKENREGFSSVTNVSPLH